MFIKQNISRLKLKSGKVKTYTSILLVESYRDGKRIKHKKIANLSCWSKEKIDSFKAWLKGKQFHSFEEVTTGQGKAIGALSVFTQLAGELGITKVVEKKWLSKVLMLITGRILTQGSRLRLLEWGRNQEIKEILGIDPEDLTADDLYDTLDYLAADQEIIEKKLFDIRVAKTGKTPRIYLYDVTSSYLEGTQNELALWGYNRDKKIGKMQIVIGLMTDEEGYPLTARVFEGNTKDPKTVLVQIKKLADSFGVKEIIFIGDKGMIKSTEIKDLTEEKYFYITSITKPQIRTLLDKGAFTMSLFDEGLSEVNATEEITVDIKKKLTITKEIRYVLRRNPIRALEMEKTRLGKQERIKREITKKNNHLAAKPRAKIETAEKNLKEYIERLKCPWVTVSVSNRVFTMTVDEQVLAEEKVLDGCYVIKTDYLDTYLTKEIIHERYKDLKYVEYAFRTIKTGFLEIRPIYLRNAGRTRGHILVTMLAYLLIHEFKKRTKSITGTLDFKVDSLDRVHTVELKFGEHRVRRVPAVNLFVQELLKAMKLKLPIFCSI
ncbi:MAG: IS1634 family transposase [Patescibacteria group bacterium]